ncbi:MAG: hypothetical protein KGL61_17845 [Burkholderiales bacterium]|nr:hypothetical protein [Burkholderiales bacterium]
MTDEEALTTLIDSALKTIEGNQGIKRAAESLHQQCASGRFNTERATEVFKIAVDNAVWEMIKDLPVRSSMYRDYRKSGLGVVYARQLTEEFKDHSGARDQRPPRRFLRFLLGA